MPHPEPKSAAEIQAFSALLSNPTPEAFAGVDAAAFEAFKRDYNEHVAVRPWFKTMLPAWGPLWVLILTSLIGMRWGVIFWLLGLAWMFTVNYRRFTANRARWAELMQRGRTAGIIQ